MEKHLIPIMSDCIINLERIDAIYPIDPQRKDYQVILAYPDATIMMNVDAQVAAGLLSYFRPNVPIPPEQPAEEPVPSIEGIEPVVEEEEAVGQPEPEQPSESEKHQPDVVPFRPKHKKK